MESRLGHDFSRVRVHTDSRAARAADALDARAFTLGRDVVFGQGSWAPRTDAGLELLAHELTHVVQGPHDAVQRQTRSGVETGTQAQPLQRASHGCADAYRRRGPGVQVPGGQEQQLPGRSRVGLATRARLEDQLPPATGP